jgi:hypothetical protein
VKRCYLCNKIKKINEFHKDITRKDGHCYICKSCRKKTNRKILPENRKILDRNIQNSINRSIKKNKSGMTWERIVGYTLIELKKHLENQFDEKMNWNNFGSYWWIDKIIPKCEYVYTGKTNELKKCWSLKNLRPLESSKCRSKKDALKWNLIYEYNLFDILPVGKLNIDKNENIIYKE